ncbi:hypothetical protein ACFX4N_24235 [Priestia sp. YIM B13551]|uniref:hypothetical protein n=1 Tax=Priestia sp. YIM B13551 TaxID=3366306 RepID=UPI00366CC242
MVYIERVFKEIKSEMIKSLEELQLTDFAKHYDWMQSHYKIIEQLAELKDLEYRTKTETEHTIEKINVEETKAQQETQEKAEEIEEEDKEDDQYPVGHCVTFEKKAFGGILKEIGYLIPEEFVRKYSMENGNKIKITNIKGTFAGGNPIYDFAVADRVIDPKPNLAEIKHGIVDMVGGRLVVSATTSGDIKIDESPVTLFISDKDANRLRVQKNDIIDGRFYTNNVTSFRVTYKYNTEQAESTASVESRKLQHRQNTQAETEPGFSMIERLDKTAFEGKKIVLVGLKSRMNDFRASLDKVEEIDMVHLDGDEHKTRIRSRILKADIVILSTYENSHSTTKYVAALCNEFDIPCKSTSADGLFGVLRDAKQLIEQLAA